jgi:hypothetical protein
VPSSTALRASWKHSWLLQSSTITTQSNNRRPHHKKTTEERKMEEIQPHEPQRLVTLKQRNEKCVHHEIFSLRSTKIAENPLISNLEQAAKTREPKFIKTPNQIFF